MVSNYLELVIEFLNCQLLVIENSRSSFKIEYMENIKKKKSYLALVCLVGFELYEIQANSKKEAAKKAVDKINSNKFRYGKNLQYYDLPILVAVQIEGEKGSTILYRIENKGIREVMKKVETVDEIKSFLRSSFRAIREQVKDLDDFRRKVETFMKKMLEEFGPTRR